MAAGAHVVPGLFDPHDGDDGGEVNSPRVTHDVQVRNSNSRIRIHLSNVYGSLEYI